MHKQKGFTLVEGLLIVIAVGIIGFAGYYVWNQNQEDETESSSSSQEESVADNDNDALNESDSEEESGSKQTITHSQLGYTVTIPDGWTASEQQYEYDDDSGNFYHEISIKSSDFKDIPNEAYPLLEDGAEITIIALGGQDYPYDTSDISLWRDSEANHDNTTEELDVGGNVAIRYIWAYEGSPYYRVVFNKDGVNYQMNLQIPFNGYDDLREQYSKYLEMYDSVIESFKFN